MLPLDANKPVTASPPGKPAPDRALVPVADSGPGAPSLSPVPGNSPEKALLQALRRRWLLALSLGLLAAGLAGAATWVFLPPIYTAEALVQVASRAPRATLDGDQNEGGEDFAAYQRTQAALLKSRTVLEVALQQPAVKESGLVRGSPDPIPAIGTSLQVDSLLGPEILRLRLTGDNPQELADLLNAVANAYIGVKIKEGETNRLALIKELQSSYDSQKRILAQRRNDLKELQESLGVEDPQTALLKYQSALQELSTTERELFQVNLDARKAQMELGAVDGKDSSPGLPVPDVNLDEYLRQDPVAQKLLARVAQLAEDIENIKSVAAPGNQASLLEKPTDELIAAQRALEDYRKQARPALETQWREKAQGRLAFLREQQKGLDEEVRRLQGVVKALGAANRQPDRPTSKLQEMQDEVANADAALKKIADRLDSLKLEPPKASRAQLMEPAQAPHSRDLKTQYKLAGLAGAGLFGLVFFGIGWWEARAQRIHTVDDIQALGLNVIGTLPALPASARRVLPGAKGGRNLFWQNLMTESVDALRTLLLHAAHSEPLRVVMVTSAMGGEGKTSLASHLAASLARGWRRTLLIDGDLRNPAAHRQFDLTLQPGLSEVLRGEAEADDVIQATPIGRLWLLSAGRWDSHAIQALAQEGVRDLFERLKEHYDYIIIDSSPVLPVADTLLLGQHVDGVFFTVLRDVSRTPTVFAAYKRLFTLGIRILGTVAIGAQGDVSSVGYQYPKMIGAKAGAE